MRIKSQWFRNERPKTPREIAGAAAFIAWRIAQHALGNMRKADFEISPGPRYFDFLAEWLIFIVQLADRIAFEKMPAAAREEFTAVMANRVGDILADNRSELLGTADAADGGDRHKRRFIDLLNLRSFDYADYDYTEARIDYGFLRCLADHLAVLVAEDEAVWVRDQVMEIEAPEAVESIRKGMRGLLGEAPQRGSRAAQAGD
ncbi:MAG TPA: hypothetical protein PL143_15360 [Rhodocyclaceae bacterium]|nr:hypothetical protein [Rhodocyclaceae bacterium]